MTAAFHARFICPGPRPPSTRCISHTSNEVIAATEALTSSAVVLVSMDNSGEKYHRICAS
jgi:hypothetical protein